MYGISMYDIVAQILSAGGPPLVRARSVAPLQRTLRELNDDLGRTGGLTTWRNTLRFEPSPDGGTRAEGANAAFMQLAGEGILVAEGAGWEAHYTVDEERLRPHRLAVRRLNADEATAVYRAGRRWAALAATELKSASISPTSSPVHVASSGPNLLKLADRGSR